MTLVTMQHMPLATAYLCQDCNCIGDNARQCPACASEVLMNLAGVLDREENGSNSKIGSSRKMSYSALPAPMTEVTPNLPPRFAEHAWLRNEEQSTALDLAGACFRNRTCVRARLKSRRKGLESSGF